MTSIFSVAAGHVDHAGNVAATMNNRMLMEENKRLQEQLAARGRKVQSLAKQLSTASADVAKSVKSVAEYDVLEGKLRDCGEERDQLNYELTKSLREKEDMRVLIGKLQEQVQEVEKTHQAHIETSNEKNLALKNLLESASSKVVEMSCRKEAVESNFIAAQQQVQALQEELAEMELKQKYLLQDLRTLTAEKVQAAKEISALRTSIKTNEQLRKQMEAKTATVAYEKLSAEKDLQKLRADHKQLDTTKNSLVATLTARDRHIQSQTEKIQQAEAETARKIAELERVSNKLGMVSHSHDIALVEIEDLKDSLKGSRQSLDKMKMESQQMEQTLQSQLEACSKQKGDLSNDLEVTIGNLMTTREEVANLKEQLMDREHKIKEEKQKLAQLGGSEKIKVLDGVGTIASLTESHF